jgi:hypothetical protein
MKPVNGATDFRAELQRPVTSGNVGEFMEKDDTAAGVGPLSGYNWK